MYPPEPKQFDTALVEPSEPEVMGAAAWMGSGFVLPCANPDFYHYAARRKIGPVLAFFVLFNVLICLIVTVRTATVMADARAQIGQAFVSGQFPEITISGGLAKVDAPQPVVLLDADRTLVVIDTTGRTAQPDRQRYSHGVVLTRDSLLVLSEGQYQQIPLTQLQELLQSNRIVINADVVTKLWDQLTVWITVGTLIFELLWKLLVGIVWLLFLAWIVRGLASLFKKKVEFVSVLITGIYALVPATYLGYLLGRVNVRFFLMPTLILLVIWGLALIPALRDPLPGEAEKTNLAGWQMGVGVPMLLIFAWDNVVMLPDAVTLVMLVTVVTMGLYITMTMFFGPKSPEDEQVEQISK